MQHAVACLNEENASSSGRLDTTVCCYATENMPTRARPIFHVQQGRDRSSRIRIIDCDYTSLLWGVWIEVLLYSRTDIGLRKAPSSPCKDSISGWYSIHQGCLFPIRH